MKVLLQKGYYGAPRESGGSSPSAYERSLGHVIRATVKLLSSGSDEETFATQMPKAMAYQFEELMDRESTAKRGDGVQSSGTPYDKSAGKQGEVESCKAVDT